MHNQYTCICLPYTQSIYMYIPPIYTIDIHVYMPSIYTINIHVYTTLIQIQYTELIAILYNLIEVISNEPNI